MTPLMSQMIGWVKSISPEVVHICDTKGELKLKNLTIPNGSIMTIIPDGYHLTTIQIFDEIDDNILNITYWSKSTK